MDALRRALDHGEDAGKILFLSEKVLQQNPSDALAVHCKAVAIVHSSGLSPHRLAAAASCFQTLERLVISGAISDDTIGCILGIDCVATLVFQHAYVLYRQNMFDAVISMLSASGPGAYCADVGAYCVNNLLGQAYYNTERFEEAAAIYESLLTETDDEEDRSNIITNLTACYAAMGATDRCDAAIRKADEKLFEHVLNGATAAIESENPDEARAMLDRAEQLLRRSGEGYGATLTTLEALEAAGPETLSLSSSDKEFADDYALVLLQRAFIAHRFDGDVLLAERMLTPIITLGIGSQTTAAIAAVNLAAIKNHNVFFDTYRTLKHVQTPVIFGRFNRRQKRVVQFNTALLLLHMGKLGDCRRIATKLAADHRDWHLVPLLLVAVLLADKKMGSAAVEAELEKHLGTSSFGGTSTSIGSAAFKCLVVAQIRIRSGDIDGAADALMSEPSLLSYPSIVSTLCDLQVACGRLTEAAQLLARRAGAGGSSKAAVRIAEQLVHADAPSEATSLLGACGSSNEVQAMLVLAEASTSVTSAEESARDLAMPLSAVSSGCVEDEDADAISSKLPSRSEVEARGFLTSSAVGEDTRRSGNRRRPMRHPCKNLKPDAKLDYERWLPLSIRTYYKDLPERRKKDMRRIRRDEQAAKRKQAERRKAEALTA